MVEGDAADAVVRSSPGMRDVQEEACPELRLPMLPVRPGVVVLVLVVVVVREVVGWERGSSKVLRSAGVEGVGWLVVWFWFEVEKGEEGIYHHRGRSGRRRRRCRRLGRFGSRGVLVRPCWYGWVRPGRLGVGNFRY